jgi:hypothetical protein
MGEKMKRPGNRRGCDQNLPLPIALLFGTTLFFAGYYISLIRQGVRSLTLPLFLPNECL